MDDMTRLTGELITLRSEPRSLRDWVEKHLLGDGAWSDANGQHVVEHMTAVLDALAAGETPPSPS